MTRLLLVAVAAASVFTAATAGRAGGPATRTAGTTAAALHPSVRVTPLPATKPAPNRLVIPALGVRAPLVAAGAVGRPGSATLSIPADIHTVAWWDGDFSTGRHERVPLPGDPGVALVAGHVDSAAAGPGALYNLGHLQVGDVVRVTVLGRTTTWRVARPSELTPKTALPRALFRSTGPARLAIVTCGGGFDAATGHYLDNVIVWMAPAQTS